jgi:hypothetical protein
VQLSAPLQSDIYACSTLCITRQIHIKRQAIIRVMGSANTSTSPIDIFMGTEPISGCFHYIGQRSLFLINSYLHIKAPLLHHLPI